MCLFDSPEWQTKLDTWWKETAIDIKLEQLFKEIHICLNIQEIPAVT